MSNLSKKDLEKCRQIAASNMSHWIYTEAVRIEQQARCAARYLGEDEEQWERMVPLLESIEEGRLRAVTIFNNMAKANESDCDCDGMGAG